MPYLQTVNYDLKGPESATQQMVEEASLETKWRFFRKLVTTIPAKHSGFGKTHLFTTFLLKRTVNIISSHFASPVIQLQWALLLC